MVDDNIDRKRAADLERYGDIILAAMELLVPTADRIAEPGPQDGAREAWRFDIDNAPEYPDACWVGDSKSGVHIVCRRGQRNMRGVWYIAWANKMLPWLPDCWMPIPPSPPLRSRAAANRSAT